MKINDVVKTAHTAAAVSGWWQTGLSKVRSIPEKLMMVVTEIAEAMEVYRTVADTGLIWHDNDGKPEGFPIEIADTVIRLFDLCGALGIDLEQAITLKMAYNDKRPFRHGNKRA